MPKTRGDLIELFKSLLCPVTTAYIEKVNGYNPGGQGHQFQFGRNVEMPEAILETLGVRIVLVTPQQWQKALGLGHRTKPETPLPRKPTPAQEKAYRSAAARCKTAWKNKLKSEAERRFPGIKVTLETADALLLLDYAWRLENPRTPEQEMLA